MIKLKIFITGCAGYIGSTATRLFLESGYSVNCVDKLLHTGKSLIPLLQFETFNFKKVDIYNINEYEDMIDSETAVIHLAAIVGEPASRKYPEETKRTNLEATKKLIEVAQRKQVKHFVFVSTCSNYGQVKEDEYATEDYPLNPLSLYAETKVAIEEFLKNEIKDSLNWTILRFATVYGLSPRMRFDLTVNDFTMHAIVDGKLLIYLPYSNRPYVHVLDVSRALKMVIENPENVIHEIFNVGNTAENYRKIDIVNLIKKEIGEIEVEFVEKGNDPRDYKVSFEKIKGKLGYSVTRKVPDGIKEVVFVVKNGIISDFKSKEYYNA